MTAQIVGLLIAWVVIDALVALALWAVFREPEQEGYVSAERLRGALEQIHAETKCASDVALLRMGSIARAALAPGGTMSGCAHMNPEDFCGSCAPDKLREARMRVTCWLIEAPAGAWGWQSVHWWCGQQEAGAEWTDDATIAVRFVRREDAEAVLNFLKDQLIEVGGGARVVEHVWIG